MRLKRSGKGKGLFSGYSDEQLLEMYRELQDPAIIGELFTRYTHLVFGSCFRYLGDEASAKDALMQIFEGLFETLKTSEIRHFSSWLYMVSRNHCLMEIRKSSSEQKHLKIIKEDAKDEFMESLDELHLNMEDGNGMHEKLREALRELKDEQRVCVEMMYLENLSYKDIAEKTGYNLNQVKSHIQNGKRNLKILLDKLIMMLLIFISLWI